MAAQDVPASIETRLVCVRGRVQGVGFREGCVEAATAFAVTGWVRNRLDGSVEALLQGPADALDRMQHWLANGVPAARVEAIEVMPANAPAARFTRFERRPTA